jgi:hypothetical protein
VQDLARQEGRKAERTVDFGRGVCCTKKALTVKEFTETAVPTI